MAMPVKNYSFWRFIYKLHRYLGLVSVPLILLVTATGLLLNHTDDLQLDSRTVETPIILDYYGIHAPEPLSFCSEGMRITQYGERLFFNQTPLDLQHARLLGAVTDGEMIVVALTDTLLLVSGQGEIIERIAQSQLQKIGRSQDITVVMRDDRLYRSDDQWLTWRTLPATADAEAVSWSMPCPLNAAEAAPMIRLYRSGILPWERVALDLHSGRLFGRIGVWLVDLGAILLVVLAISGLTLWLKHKR